MKKQPRFPVCPTGKKPSAQEMFDRSMKLWPIVMLALAACTPQTIVRDRIERVNVPVRVGCVTADVPKTPPLNSLYTQKQWDSLTVSQKAAAVSAQGLRRMNESDSLRGATAGCPEAN